MLRCFRGAKDDTKFSNGPGSLLTFRYRSAQFVRLIPVAIQVCGFVALASVQGQDSRDKADGKHRLNRHLMKATWIPHAVGIGSCKLVASGPRLFVFEI